MRSVLSEMLRLAGPVVVARLGIMAMGLTDVVWAIILSSVLSAACLAARFWWLGRRDEASASPEAGGA